MGVLKPLPEQLDIASVFMTPAGIIASVSRGFSNLFGHKTSDIIGGSVRHSNDPAPHSWRYLPALCCFCILLPIPSPMSAWTCSGCAAMQVKTFMKDPTFLTKACQLAKEDAQDCGQFVAKHSLGDDILVQANTYKVGATSGCEQTFCMLFSRVTWKQPSAVPARTPLLGSLLSR